MNPTSEVVAVNGVSLFTRTIGSGPQVIVLHGGPGAHHDYLLPQFDALATGRCLRYYDQRGGGQSPVDRDTPVGWREHVADLDALVTHWAAAPATLLGYSWGAMLAMLYAIEHPARVARLALVSPAAPSVTGRAEFERRFTERMRDERVQGARRAVQESGLRERDPEAYRKRIFELSVAGYFKDPDRAHDLTPFRVTGRTQDAVWKSLGDFDLRPQLAQVHLPALVAHGRHDPIPLEFAQETARLLGARFVAFEHSGHVPYVEDFDQFVSVLDEFLPSP
ncbi:MAG: alpha/beta fold hydrolase [Gemmatimonadetes bacterium]|nr:alpha/beta fold hydrolase [Gemmatimonadota bacterium]